MARAEKELPSTMPSRPLLIWTTAFIAVGCGLVAAVGVRTLLTYERAAGGVATVPNTWPASELARTPDQPTLVMLAHPHCPCTRASVAELAKIMAHLHGKARAYVLFSTPAHVSGDWEDTDLRNSAAEIPGVKIVSDIDGVEAQRFGAETSGHTLLYAPDGRLLFSGGITHSRGHAGDNAGADAIVALVRNKTPASTQTLVFGCSLPRNEASQTVQVAAK
jgi:hypothetical protein